jgi:hypothetical protein
MESNRLEAFSDGVLAIIITIMVLELKVPHRADVAALAPLLPIRRPSVAHPRPPDRARAGEIRKGQELTPPVLS